MVITEYELPRLELATHDVAGDSKGNIWYSPHRSSYIGRLDPRTGAVKEFRIPPSTPTCFQARTGSTSIKNDIVWGSENWAHNIYRFDPKTEDFTRVPWKVSEPVNSPMRSATTRSIPTDSSGEHAKNQSPRVDALTGDTVMSFVLKKFSGTYGSAMSRDGTVFRRRRMAARRHRGGRHPDRRSVRARLQRQFRARAGRVRSAGKLLGRAVAAACW